MFEKVYKFIGKDIKSLIERPDGLYCFRLHKNRIYYVSESIMKRATNVGGGPRLEPGSSNHPRIHLFPPHLRPQSPSSCSGSTHSSPTQPSPAPPPLPIQPGR